MHLRRALLLFAIVLGLAAVAASVSRPRENDNPPPTTEAQRPPAVEPGTAPEAPAGESAPGSVEVTFDADSPKAHRIGASQAATVIVEVPEPGQVSIDLLGQTDTAEPTTPASFDVLTSSPGRYPITFVPADTNETLEAGTLVVE